MFKQPCCLYWLHVHSPAHSRSGRPGAAIRPHTIVFWKVLTCFDTQVPILLENNGHLELHGLEETVWSTWRTWRKLHKWDHVFRLWKEQIALANLIFEGAGAERNQPSLQNNQNKPEPLPRLVASDFALHLWPLPTNPLQPPEAKLTKLNHLQTKPASQTELSQASQSKPTKPRQNQAVWKDRPSTHIFWPDQIQTWH